MTVARPSIIPTWASEDTTLPSTGLANKVQPKVSLQTIGWDKGQIPCAEEWNWELDSLCDWVAYFDSVLGAAGNNYLPSTGTQITLTGSATGNATFSGTNSLSIPTTIVSSGITDATSSATPLVIATRDSSGGCNFNAVSTTTLAASASVSTPVGNITALTTNSIVTSSITADSLQAGVLTTSGVTTLNSPKTSSIQGTDGASLTRYDYVNTQVANAISTVEGMFTSSLAINGWCKNAITGQVLQWGISTLATGSTVTFPITFPNNCFTVIVTDLGTGYAPYSAASWTTSNFKVYTSATTSYFTYLAIGN